MIDFGDLDQLYGQPEGASSDAALGGTADGMGTPYGSAQPEPLGDIAAPATDAIRDGDPSVRFGWDQGWVNKYDKDGSYQGWDWTS
jgi:hypothetical protein